MDLVAIVDQLGVRNAGGGHLAFASIGEKKMRHRPIVAERTASRKRHASGGRSNFGGSVALLVPRKTPLLQLR
jgi:hypothetical protein